MESVGSDVASGSVPPRSSRIRVWAVALGLVLLVAAVYGRVGGFDFLDFDDGEYVYANPEVLGGLTAHGLLWAATAFHSANWHPLTWASHMADVSLFGPEPGAHHVVNAALHAANAVVLFLVLRAATAAFWPSALVAALFVVHPLNIESVAWVSQRKSVLSALFLFLTVGSHVSWVNRGGGGRRLLVAFFLALGLLAKPMLVTAPLLLLLLDFWPLGRAGKRGVNARTLLAEKLPLFALAAASIGATLLAQSKWKAVGSVATYTIFERVLNAAVSCVLYLRDAVWPLRLACFYPHPASIGERTALLPAAGAVVLLMGISWLAVAARRSRPWLLFGWAWYLISLAPVIGLVQVGSQGRADRYTYVPMIGIYVAVVWEAANLAGARGVAREALTAAGAVVVAVLAVLGFVQAGTWRDGRSLYTHALRVTRRNWLAWNNLGMFHLGKGDAPAALAAFREALLIKPDYGIARYNTGVALGQLQRFPEAIASYREALEIDPSNADAWTNLGVALVTLGSYSEAVPCFVRALELRPNDTVALEWLTISYVQIDEPVLAKAMHERLRRVDPRLAADLLRRLREAR